MNRETDQYLKLVEWSKEDHCYVGTCPGLFLGGVHGDNEVEVYRELCEAVEEHISIYKEDGQPLPAQTNRKYSGKLSLRLPDNIHKKVAIRAFQAGQSINEYINRTLSKA